MIRRHWKHTGIYAVTNLIAFAMITGHIFSLYNPAGLFLMFLTPVMLQVFFWVVAGGVIYSIYMYIQIAKYDYEGTYWPSVVMLIISVWPFVVIFLSDGPVF
jgi:hypothetical protein